MIDEDVGAAASFRLKTLGRVELRGPSGELLRGRRKILALLAYLVRKGYGTVPRGQLAALLWGDRPESRAMSSLREALFQLRGALGPALETDRRVVSLRPEAISLDLDEMEAALEAGRPEEAVRLWGGEFLPEMDDAGTSEFRSWVEGERRVLKGMISEGLESLVRSAEERGEWNEAVTWARRWAEAAPLDQPSQSTLIRVLRFAGRQGEAVEYATLVRERFREELGMEPELPEVEVPVSSGTELSPVRPGVNSAAVFTPDIVGREKGFSELMEAWRLVMEGGAGAILLRGEQGTGKTRLIGEFLGWLPAQGDALVLRGQAFQAEATQPFSAAASLLRGVLQAPGLSAAPDSALAEVSALVPALRERYPGLPRPTRRVEALTEGVRRVVEEIAVEVPLVLFLDDLHLADSPSRCLLLALARRLPPSCLLLLAARSEDEPEGNAAEECQASGVQVLPLEPLGPTECEEMLASMLPMQSGTRQTLAGLLYRESGGNPFYFEEMVATLVDEGHLRTDHRGLWKTAEDLEEEALPLPMSVSDAVRRRLARLSPGARETLKAAAVLWPLVTAETLRDAAEMQEDTVSAGLDELLSRRLLRTGMEIPGSYRFSHELLRRVAYEEVSPHGRAHLHRRVAGLLDSRKGTGDLVAEACRYHRERAGEPLCSSSSPRPWWKVAVGIAAILALLVAWITSGDVGSEGDLPLIAIGEIRGYAGSSDPPMASALQDMLSTNLARVEDLRVLSTSRIYELAGREGLGPEAGARITRAARTAGADEVLEGTLQQTPGGLWRLDLQRIHLADGLVQDVVTVEGEEVFSLVDRATHEIAGSLGLTPPPLRLAQVTTNSLEAYRYYEKGLRAYYRGDRERGAALFKAALREDTTFAMAAFYAGRSLMPRESGEGLKHLQRAMRLADRAGERERLIIRGTWMDLLDEPTTGAYADSLLARFPDEPGGYYLKGRALLRQGDFLGAAAVLRTAVAMDSASVAAPGAPCSACEAASQAVAAYWLADSLEAAEAVAREWIRFQPEAAPPWEWLSNMLEHQGRFREAVEARRRAASLLTFSRPGDRIYPALVELKKEAFTEADRLFREHIRSGREGEVKHARWLYAISLRWQGRLEEAMEVALAYRGEEDAGGAPCPDALLQAQVLYEAGELAYAAALFDSLASTFANPLSKGQSARQRAWMLTHSADASAEAGDTVRVAFLADSIQALGVRSGFGRDHLLHHHVRGRLLLARGDTAGARRELEAAIFSLNGGFTRTNYELARLELATGHPERAIPLLQAIFRAPVDVSNFYLARTEARMLLGQAWLEAQRPDSALPHLRSAARAWEKADPTLQPRLRTVLEAIRAAEEDR